MIFLFVTILSLSTFLWSSDDEIRQIELIASGTYKIQGQSNIAPFQCEFRPYRTTDTLSIGYSKETVPSYNFHDARIELDIAAFDCGNRIINNDFCKMLQEAQYPKLRIQLKAVSISKENKENKEGEAKVTIGIAGMERDYTLPFEWCHQDGKYKINACFDLNTRDFELTPPRKLMGLLKVKNDIEVKVEHEISKVVF